MKNFTKKQKQKNFYKLGIDKSKRIVYNVYRKRCNNK